MKKGIKREMSAFAHMRVIYRDGDQHNEFPLYPLIRNESVSYSNIL